MGAVAVAAISQYLDTLEDRADGELFDLPPFDSGIPEQGILGGDGTDLLGEGIDED